VPLVVRIAHSFGTAADAFCEQNALSSQPLVSKLTSPKGECGSQTLAGSSAASISAKSRYRSAAAAEAALLVRLGASRGKGETMFLIVLHGKAK